MSENNIQCAVRKKPEFYQKDAFPAGEISLQRTIYLRSDLAYFFILDVLVFGEVDETRLVCIIDLIQTLLNKVSEYYRDHGIAPKIPKYSQLKLIVKMYEDQHYRNLTFGPNLWRHNYVLGSRLGEQLYVNSSIMDGIADDTIEGFDIYLVLSHELRHWWLKVALEHAPSKYTFPIDEGLAGLVEGNATARLVELAKNQKEEIPAPLSIRSWDKERDKAETDLRCFINSLYYLVLFSFYHDFVCIEKDLLAKLAEFRSVVYRTDSEQNKVDICVLWAETYPELPSLQDLQKEWIDWIQFEHQVTLHLTDISKKTTT